MIVRWCPGDDTGKCRGGFCEHALEHAGRDTIAIVHEIEEGRRPDDVLRLMTAKVAQATVTRPSDGLTVLSPDAGEYLIHSTQGLDGTRYWTALYSGHLPLDQVLAREPEWTQDGADERQVTALAQLEDRLELERAGRPPERRKW